MICSVRIGDDWLRIDTLPDEQLLRAIAHYTNDILIDRNEVACMPSIPTAVHPLDLVLNCFVPDNEEGDSGWRRAFDETVANFVSGCLCNLEILEALACEAVLRELCLVWVSGCLQKARNRTRGNQAPLKKTDFVALPEAYR